MVYGCCEECPMRGVIALATPTPRYWCLAHAHYAIAAVEAARAEMFRHQLATLEP